MAHTGLSGELEETMDYGLQGKTVLITGGSSGIGLRAVEAFAHEGARVVVADRNPVSISISGAAHDVETHEVDVTDAASVNRWVDSACERHGGIDVLVNNAGLAPFRNGFLSVTDDDWRALFETNLLGYIRVARAVIPHMISHRGGAIVHLASDIASQPDPFFVDYAASKSAVLSMSKSLSIEFGKYGIRSNCVAPGPTATPGMQEFLHRLGQDRNLSADAARDYFVKDMRKLPLGRMSEPSDVAAVVLFLASDQARQVTGSSYRVDAGSHVFL